MRAAPGRLLAGGLLLLTAAACLCIADATVAVERANQRRHEQLQLLAEQLRQPEPPGGAPLSALDGLFVRRLESVPTAAGPLLAFVGGAGGCP